MFHHLFISAIIAGGRNFVEIHCFRLSPQLLLSQIGIIFTYPGCPLTHPKEKVCFKARVYLWFNCANGLF